MKPTPTDRNDNTSDEQMQTVFFQFAGSSYCILQRLFEDEFSIVEARKTGDRMVASGGLDGLVEAIVGLARDANRN